MGKKGRNNSNQSNKPSGRPMTRDDARRIQSHSDRTGKNPGFKQRAQRAASKRPSKK